MSCGIMLGIFKINLFDLCIILFVIIDFVENVFSLLKNNSEKSIDSAHTHNDLH